MKDRESTTATYGRMRRAYRAGRLMRARRPVRIRRPRPLVIFIPLDVSMNETLTEWTSRAGLVSSHLGVLGVFRGGRWLSLWSAQGFVGATSSRIRSFAGCGACDSF